MVEASIFRAVLRISSISRLDCKRLALLRFSGAGESCCARDPNINIVLLLFLQKYIAIMDKTSICKIYNRSFVGLLRFGHLFFLFLFFLGKAFTRIKGFLAAVDSG